MQSALKIQSEWMNNSFRELKLINDYDKKLSTQELRQFEQRMNNEINFMQRITSKNEEIFHSKSQNLETEQNELGFEKILSSHKDNMLKLRENLLMNQQIQNNINKEGGMTYEQRINLQTAINHLEDNKQFKLGKLRRGYDLSPDQVERLKIDLSHMDDRLRNMKNRMK